MHKVALPAPACLLALTAAFAGCQDPCYHIGEECSNVQFCCVSEGLLCQPGPQGSFCSKGCRCQAGLALCTPNSFGEGCPQGSACLATANDGRGQCVVLCNQPPCPVGSYRCSAPGDGGDVTCAAVDAGIDGGESGDAGGAGAPDLSAPTTD